MISPRLVSIFSIYSSSLAAISVPLLWWQIVVCFMIQKWSQNLLICVYQEIAHSKDNGRSLFISWSVSQSNQPCSLPASQPFHLPTWICISLVFSRSTVLIFEFLNIWSSELSSNHLLMVLFTFWSSGIVSVFRLLNLQLYISWTSVISVLVQMGYLEYSSLCDADSWAFNMSFKWCIFSLSSWIKKIAKVIILTPCHSSVTLFCIQ